MEEWMDGIMNWIDGWIAWVDGWVDEWINRHTFTVQCLINLLMTLRYAPSIFSLSTVLQCDNLTNPAHGQVILSSLVLDSQANYSCNQGYKLSGVEVRTCQANELWSGSEPTCEGKQVIILHYVLLISLYYMHYVLCSRSGLVPWLSFNGTTLLLCRLIYYANQVLHGLCVLTVQKV